MIEANDERICKSLTPEQFKALARYKGWSYVMLGERWGYTPVWISNIARDPQRPIRFDDMLHGLPNLKRLARDSARKKKVLDAAIGNGPKRPAPAPSYRGPGFRYRGYIEVGAILTATASVGSMAEEGDRGIVFQVITSTAEERYGVIFENGMWDWFAPAHIDNWLAVIGLMSPSCTNYQYKDETRLQTDFASGLFNFWPD